MSTVESKLFFGGRGTPYGNRRLRQGSGVSTPYLKDSTQLVSQIDRLRVLNAFGVAPAASENTLPIIPGSLRFGTGIPGGVSLVLVDLLEWLRGGYLSWHGL